MAPTSSSESGIDPRYPEAFQRGGAAAAPVVESASALRSPTAGRASVPRDVSAPDLSRRVAAADAEPALFGDERHFELIVAGNPWLRSLWIVGVIATLAGFALTAAIAGATALLARAQENQVYALMVNRVGAGDDVAAIAVDGRIGDGADIARVGLDIARVQIAAAFGAAAPPAPAGRSTMTFGVTSTLSTETAPASGSCE